MRQAITPRRVAAALTAITLLSLGNACAHAADAARAPTLEPAGGSYVVPIAVVAVAPRDAVVRYTVDGTLPTVDSWPFTHRIAVTDSTTITACSFVPGLAPSAPTTATYRIHFPLTTARPVATPPAGAYPAGTRIALATTTPGAQIRYTVDGSEPTLASPRYDAPLPLTVPITLRARAFGGRVGLPFIFFKLPAVFPSGVMTAVYTLRTATVAEPPTLAPGGGSFHDVVAVTVTTATAGGVVRFTVDGSDPSALSPILGTLTVDRSMTIRAQTFAPGAAPSAIVAAQYTLQALAPSATPPAGSYHDSVGVALATPTGSTQVRYRLDGVDPSASDALADAPVALASDAVLTARAFRDGWTPSDVARFAYSFIVADPSLSPAAGEYGGPVAVVATTTTPSAVVRYTIDGSEPSASSPAVDGPITIATSTTLSVRAFRDGFAPSATVVAAYAIVPPIARFATGALTVDESVGSAVLRIDLDRASTVPVTIGYRYTALSARRGKDAIMIDGVVSIPAGERTASLATPIVDDATYERDESFLVTLASADAAVIAADGATATVTIRDNDPPPAVSFAQSALTVREDVGTALLPVLLSTASGMPVAIRFHLEPGTLTPGSDYIPVGDPLTIAADLAQDAIRIPVIEDGLPEAPEYLDVVLDGADGATLGATTRCRFTVISTDRANAVASWFARARALVAQTNTDPPAASRVYALLGVAQRSAVRALVAGSGVSTDGAITAASWTILAGLFPTRADELRAAALAAVALPGWSGFRGESVVADGDVGRAAALAVLAAAADDGSAAVWTGSPPVGDGLWYPSWAYTKPALRPLWGRVRPWFMPSGDAFRPSPPPAWGSPEYRAALAEVRAISDHRTDEQLAIAGFWADGPGSPTPAGHWCAIAEGMLLADGVDETRSAELMGLLGATMMDAGIACWDCKYAYWLIRPYQADRSISTPIGQPNFPSYISGHATFSGAAAEILAHAFPAHADELRAQAEQAALSRLYGGIHYRFDNDLGLAMGRRIAAAALAEDATGSWHSDLAPRIVITSPAPGSAVDASPTITAAITVVSLGAAAVTVDVVDGDGAAHPIVAQVQETSGGAWSLNAVFASPLGEGVYRATVVATDAAGHRGSAITTFAVAPGAAPRVVIDAPADGGVVGMSAPVVARGHVDRPVASLTVDGVAVAVAGDLTFSASLAIDPFAVIRQPLMLMGGINEIAVLATDHAGRTGRATIDLRVDDSRPRLHIEQPADGAMSELDTITVSGRVEDVVLGEVDSDSVAVVVGGVTAAVRNASFLASVPLVVGSNHIAVTATDRAGNATTTAIDVVRRTGIGYVLRSVGGDLQEGAVSTALPAPLRIWLEDRAGAPVAKQPVTFAVARGDGTLTEATDDVGRRVTLLTDAAGEASVHLRLGTTSGVGNQQVEVTAVGAPASLRFTESAQAGPLAAILIASGDAQSGPVGGLLPQPLVAWAADAAGNAIGALTVTFAVADDTAVVAGRRDAATWASTFSTTTDADGRASAYVALRGTAGVDRVRVTASAAPPPARPAVFAASIVASTGLDQDTAITGIVLSTEKRPIAGVTLSIDGTTIGAVSDAHGRFAIVGVPAGHRHLIVTGTTANHDDVRYPTLGFEVDLLRGATLRMPMPIYLPTMDRSGEALAGGDNEVVLQLPGIGGAQVVIAPHSTIRGDGVRGPVWMYTSVVNAQAVPMPAPNGMTPALAATLQPSGTRLDPPARVRWPNIQGLAPGAQTRLFSFDHDLGQFVSQGTLTVSEDGAYLETDAGSGILKAGWYLTAEPPVPMADVEDALKPAVTAIHVSPHVHEPHVEFAGTSPTYTLTAQTDIEAKDEDVTWTCTAGSFANGATTATGLTVTWTMDQGYVSHASDDIVIVAAAERGAAHHAVTAFQVVGNTISTYPGMNGARSSTLAVQRDGVLAAATYQAVAVALNDLPASEWRLTSVGRPDIAIPLESVFRAAPVASARTGGIVFTVDVLPQAPLGDYLLSTPGSHPSSEHVIIAARFPPLTVTARPRMHEQSRQAVTFLLDAGAAQSAKVVLTGPGSFDVLGTQKFIMVEPGVPTDAFIYAGLLDTQDISISYRPLSASTFQDSMKIQLYRVKHALLPRDNFAGREVVAFGCGEMVDVATAIVPASVTVGDIGVPTWSIGGIGPHSSVLNESAHDGTAVLACGLAGDLSLVTTLAEDEDYLGGAVQIKTDYLIWAPVKRRERNIAAGTLHHQGVWSAGMRLDLYLDPKTVSFHNLLTREGTAPAVTTGWFALEPYPAHDAQVGALTESTVSPGNATKGCRIRAIDTAYFVKAGVPASGTVTWNIPDEFRINNGVNDSAWIQFGITPQVGESDETGTATTTKDGNSVVFALDAPTVTFSTVSGGF